MLCLLGTSRGGKVLNSLYMLHQLFLQKLFMMGTIISSILQAKKQTQKGWVHSSSQEVTTPKFHSRLTLILKKAFDHPVLFYSQPPPTYLLFIHVSVGSLAFYFRQSLISNIGNHASIFLIFYLTIFKKKQSSEFKTFLNSYFM